MATISRSTIDELHAIERRELLIGWNEIAGLTSTRGCGGVASQILDGDAELLICERLYFGLDVTLGGRINCVYMNRQQHATDNCE